MSENYIKQVSFYSTWIANFGIWREDFLKIEDKDRYADLQFVQVDWSYKIIKNRKKTFIYFNDFFNIANLNKKGGYNLFDAFVNKYLFIIKNERFSLFIYEFEKYRLCMCFIYGWLKRILVKERENYNFETEKAFKIIFKKYWYEPYLYPMLLLFLFQKVKKN